MSFVVRAATQADIAAMSRVLTASITELCVADHRHDPDALAAWTANKSEAGIAGMLANSGSRVLVVESDEAVIAVGAVSKQGMVTLNYVDPTARFRGVSKILLVRLEAELLAMGFGEGRLEATATALRFYEAAGWQLDGPQAEGRRVNGYPMSKRLDGRA